MGVVVKRKKGQVKAYLAGGREIVKVERKGEGGVLHLKGGGRIETSNRHLVEVLLKKLGGEGK